METQRWNVYEKFSEKNINWLGAVTTSMDATPEVAYTKGCHRWNYGSPVTLGWELIVSKA